MSLRMFSLTNMPSTATVLSKYTAFTASAMLIRTMINEVQAITSQFIPQQLQVKAFAKFGGLFEKLSAQMTLHIDEYNGFSINEIYQAAEIYLSTKITPSNDHLKVSKSPRDSQISVTVNKGETIIDEYDGIQLRWEFISTEVQKSYFDQECYSQCAETSERKMVQLSFHKRFKDKVLGTYLPYVIERSKAIKEENKLVKLYSLGGIVGNYDGGPWGSINFEHPSTFDTLAMDPKLKKELIDDLDRFLERREYYKRVGKAWKRGYLLYGPPGTGKSSLIAAMANYLKFDIYDMELTHLTCNSELRRLLVSTSNRSILVIEDVDCSIEFADRQLEGYNRSESQLTLSGLLNFIDGLWTSCGDERIIVFTTNYKDKLDPALLRPGRMDMHINMSYCTPCGFEILASNYLRIKDHHLFSKIKEMLKEVEITPAEVAEELMKRESADKAMEGLVEFLQQKKGMNCKQDENVEERKEDDKEGQGLDVKQGKKSGAKKNKRKTAKKRKGRQ